MGDKGCPLAPKLKMKSLMLAKNPASRASLIKTAANTDHTFPRIVRELTYG
jgi:hypothetical protein